MSGGSCAKLIWSDKWPRLAIRSNLSDLLKAEKNPSMSCLISLFLGCFFCLFVCLWFFLSNKKKSYILWDLVLSYRPYFVYAAAFRI